MLFLGFLTNQYRLNPKPDLILVVEGYGEAEQFPRLAKEFGVPFPRLGIEIVNLVGVDQFVGRGNENPYSSLEKFIDYHHHKQTFVFVVLDKDDTRVERLVAKLQSKPPHSIFSNRKITKREYVHLWNKTIEFDNFSYDEIARAMTRLSDNRYVFTPEEIAYCEPDTARKGKGNLLARLYREKVGYDLPKRELLAILCDYILDRPTDGEGVKRPIVGILEKIIKLASLNHQPVSLDLWKRNQASGYLGDPVPEVSPSKS